MPPRPGMSRQLASDTIEFSVGVGSNGTYNSDSTGLTATITASGGASANVRWLVTDQLGTPRMANVKRHDYLPFGEELFALTGGPQSVTRLFSR